MSKWGIRIIGLLILLLMSLMATPLARAQDGENPGQIPDCLECHESIYERWAESAHGQGISCDQCHSSDQERHDWQEESTQADEKDCMRCHTTGYDPATNTWEADNIHCVACHSPVPSTHPNVPMSINRSEDLCGKCHIQARFEWQNSRHGQMGIACVSCHSQHRTGLKSESVAAQCANCHQNYTDGFSHTLHNEEGLTCAVCHLAPLTEPLRDGSAKRDHTFHVDVKACVSCHKEGLHNGSKAEAMPISFKADEGLTLDAMASSVDSNITAEPPGVSPTGFAILLGLGLGIIIGGLLTMSVVLTRSLVRRVRQQQV